MEEDYVFAQACYKEMKNFPKLQLTPIIFKQTMDQYVLNNMLQRMYFPILTVNS